MTMTYHRLAIFVFIIAKYFLNQDHFLSTLWVSSLLLVPHRRLVLPEKHRWNTKRIFSSTSSSYKNSILIQQNHDERIALHLSKKNKSNISASPKKIQVRMLKFIAGTGNVGDIVQVTPAFYENKLRPTKSAITVTNEEIEQERIRNAALEKARQTVATEIQNIWSNQIITLKKKAGPDGHLFGSIGPKMIMDDAMSLLQNNIVHNEKDVLDPKRLKVVAIFDADGKELKSDIKRTGDYDVTISLTKDIDAKLKLIVQPE